MAKPASIVAVVGPTAVGKTALAIQLARRFNGEIVNADSRQVYIGMDIGTAKPTAEELAAARHHLVDIRLPSEQLSLGEYLPLARRAIEDIHGRGKLPIVCGGTGQYVWALLEGWRVPKIPPDATFRAELERRAVTEGTTALWHELYKADAQRARVSWNAQYPPHYSCPGNPPCNRRQDRCGSSSRRTAIPCIGARSHG